MTTGKTLTLDGKAKPRFAAWLLLFQEHPSGRRTFCLFGKQSVLRAEEGTLFAKLRQKQAAREEGERAAYAEDNENSVEVGAEDVRHQNRKHEADQTLDRFGKAGTAPTSSPTTSC